MYFMSRQVDKTTEDRMYLHIGSRLPLKYQEMNYPNRLQRCTHEDDEIQLKLRLRDHAFLRKKYRCCLRK